MFKAFKAKACLHPATSKPVSSRLAIVFEIALAAFQRVVPHNPELSIVFLIQDKL